MLPLLLTMGTAQADIPLGTPLDDAITVDVTTDGLDAVLQVATQLVPGRIDLEDISQYDCVSEVFGVCLASYEFQVGNTPAGKEIWVEIELDQLQLVPGPSNQLVLDGIATVRVNEPSDPLYVFVEGEAIGIPISDTCDAYVRDFQVNINASVGVELKTHGPTGNKYVDFSVGTPAWSWTLDESDIVVTGSGCDLDTINDITSFFGYDLIEILIDQVEPVVDDLVLSLPSQVEPVLDSALPPLTYYDNLDVLGVPIEVFVEPEELLVEQGGLRIVMISKIDTTVAECVAPFVEDMVDTPSGLPAIDDVPGSVPFSPHVSAIIDDDFVNQALYALWAGGVMCVDLNADLGLPIPPTVLATGLLPDDEFEQLFDLDTMEVAITPTQPPRFEAAGNADVNLSLDGMGIGFFSELEGRKVRVANVNLGLELGTDVLFDGTTGELAVDIDLAGADIYSSVDFNDYLPETSEQIEEQVPATIQTLIPFISPLLADLTFSIPSFEGAGVDRVGIDPTGPANDRLGIYAGIGPVPYEAKGCEGCTGGGCSTGGTSGGIAFFLFPLTVSLLRRRRSS